MSRLHFIDIYTMFFTSNGIPLSAHETVNTNQLIEAVGISDLPHDRWKYRRTVDSIGSSGEIVMIIVDIYVYTVRSWPDVGPPALWHG